MPTSTTNFSLNKPLVNNATDQDLWGGYLNDNMDTIDAALKVARDQIKRTITSTDSLVAGDRNKLLLLDATSAAFTFTLLAAATAGDGFTVTLKKTDSSVNAITIDGSGSETIDGSLTYSVSSQYDAVQLVCDGSNWQISGKKTNTVVVTDADVSFSDITTNNASTSKHGFLKKLDNTASHYMDGTGAWSAISGLPAVSAATEGKIVFGAVTIQWGSSTSSTTVTFGTAFSGTPYSIQQTWTTSNASNTGITSSSSTGFVKAGGVPSTWIAIGPT